MWKSANSTLYWLINDKIHKKRRIVEHMVGHEPICAYAALWLGLNALYGWRELPALTYNKYGKPAFAEHPEVQFNLSHTRGAVLVGIHDRPIDGV